MSSTIPGTTPQTPPNNPLDNSANKAVANAIDRLKTDHRRMRNVLGALQHRVDDIAAPLSEGTRDHLYCLLSYMADYPDAVHHPLEKRVFASLWPQTQGKKPPRELLLLEDQHQQQGRCTDALLEALLEPDPDLKTLQHELSRYIELQVQHMEFEEREIFPLAEGLLSDPTYEFSMPDIGIQEDPLFEKLEQRFRNIYKYLEVDPLESARAELAEPLYKYLGGTGLIVE